MKNTAYNRENGITKKDARKVFSHIGFSLFFYDVAVLLLQSALVFLVMWGFALFGYDNSAAEKFVSSNEFIWTSSIICQFFLGSLVCFILLSLKKPLVKFSGEKRRFTFKQTVLMGIVCIAVMQFGSMISTFLSEWVRNLRGAPLENSLSSLVYESNVFVVILVCVIIGPILEELIYRKCVIDRLRPFGEWFAVICSALIFGLAHGNFLQLFYSVGIGIIFGIIYLKTNNIGICIGYHIFINFLGGVVPVLLSRIDTETEAALLSPANIALLAYIFLLLLITFAGILILFAAHKSIRLSARRVEGISKIDTIKAFIFNFGMILLLIITVYSFIMSF